MKIAIYTAIFGAYDQLIPQPKLPNVDFICFTDGDLRAKNWEVRKVSMPIVNDPARSNRYYKILPHLHLQDYDYSIYIDGNMLIINSLENLVAEVFKQADMGAFVHSPPLSNSENCIYKEHERISELGKSTGKWLDNPDIMQQHVNFLIEEGYPKKNGLIVGSVLFRKHHSLKVKETMNLWWKMVSERSKRDQLSFNYAAWKTNLEICYIPGEVRYENPWFYRLGGHKQSLWFRMLKYKLRKFSGKINHPNEDAYLKQLNK